MAQAQPGCASKLPSLRPQSPAQSLLLRQLSILSRASNFPLLKTATPPPCRAAAPSAAQPSRDLPVLEARAGLQSTSTYPLPQARRCLCQSDLLSTGSCCTPLMLEQLSQ